MHSTFTDREMRDALSAFATGVTIVTGADAEHRPIGMTASSFNSVSMDPPLILWSVTKSALSADAFKQAAHFAVHVLGRDQVALSNRFAKTGTDKFAETDFELDDNGVPVFEQCACRFDCRHWAAYEGGDHWIIVGEVIALHRSTTESLVFSGGSYATAIPLARSSDTSESVESRESPVDSLLIYNLSRAYRQIADQFHGSVRETGLTVPEWRILASLHGASRRNLSDLAARTFIDPSALQDTIKKMQEDGLCRVFSDYDSTFIVETDDGHQRVKHLFDLSVEQERTAVGDDQSDNLQTLVSLLKSVIANTDKR